MFKAGFDIIYGILLLSNHTKQVLAKCKVSVRLAGGIVYIPAFRNCFILKIISTSAMAPGQQVK